MNGINLFHNPFIPSCAKTSNRKYISFSKPLKFQLVGYNWDIANDTNVPLPGCEEYIDWLLAWWDYWDYYFQDVYLAHLPCNGGHC